MRLKDVFVRLLRSREIEVISTSLDRIIHSDDVIQAMAVMIANGKAMVCRGHRGVSFNLKGERVDERSEYHVGTCEDPVISRRELLAEAEKEYFPYIVVDCSTFEGHTEKEKRKVIFQISQTLGVVRRFMWDERLVVTHLNCGYGVYYETTEMFIRESGVEDVILLDPYGEEVFEGQRGDCFIIGGIVDKTGDKVGWTSKIGERLRRSGIEIRSVRILLRGDIVGVPDRINTIAEIVLRVVLDGEDVEEAIRNVQSRLVARWRLRKELPKLTVRVDINGRPFRFIRKSEYKGFDWLNVTEEDFYRVCSELGYIAVKDEVLDRIVEEAVWDERKRRYILQSYTGR